MLRPLPTALMTLGALTLLSPAAAKGVRAVLPQERSVGASTGTQNASAGQQILPPDGSNNASHSPSRDSAAGPPSENRLSTVCLEIAVVSAHVGAIVVLFVVLAIQELRRIQSQNPIAPQSYRVLRDKSRLHVFLFTGTIAMSVLLLDSIVVLFFVVADPARLSFLALLSVSSFTFSITTILIGLFAYFVLERPFMVIVQ
jgi:hypothetical protein